MNLNLGHQQWGRLPLQWVESKLTLSATNWDIFQVHRPNFRAGKRLIYPDALNLFWGMILSCKVTILLWTSSSTVTPQHFCDIWGIPSQPVWERVIRNSSFVVNLCLEEQLLLDLELKFSRIKDESENAAWEDVDVTHVKGSNYKVASEDAF